MKRSLIIKTSFRLEDGKNIQLEIGGTAEDEKDFLSLKAKTLRDIVTIEEELKILSNDNNTTPQDNSTYF